VSASLHTQTHNVNTKLYNITMIHHELIIVIPYNITKINIIIFNGVNNDDFTFLFHIARQSFNIISLPEKKIRMKKSPGLLMKINWLHYIS
jgi:hypothetical protein